MRTLSDDTKLQLPTNTYISHYKGKLVLSGPGGTKTIKGEHASVSATVLDECDGNTPLSDIIDEPSGHKFAIAQTLYEEGIVYPTDLLAPLELKNPYLSLFESLLLSLDQSEQESFVADIQTKAILVQGDQFLIDIIAPDIQSIGWNVNKGNGDTNADIILFLETEATDTGEREAVNKRWLNSDAILIRTAFLSEKIQFGPLLTPTAPACLDCLTSRERMNNATATYNFELFNQGRTLSVQILKAIVIQATAQAATKLIPPGFEGVIKNLRIPTLHHTESSLLAVPGCESCGR